MILVIDLNIDLENWKINFIMDCNVILEIFIKKGLNIFIILLYF